VANRSLKAGAKTFRAELVELEGRFGFAAASPTPAVLAQANPITITDLPPSISVAYVSTGLFRITCSEPFTRLVGCDVQLNYATAANDYVAKPVSGTGGLLPTSGSCAAGWTQDIQITAAGSAVNPTNAGSISFRLTLKNSTVIP